MSGYRSYLAGVRWPGRVLLTRNQSHGGPSNKICPPPNMPPANREQALARGRCWTLLPPILRESGVCQTSAEINGCKRVARTQGRNSDPAPPLADKKFRRDRTIPRFLHAAFEYGGHAEFAGHSLQVFRLAFVFGGRSPRDNFQVADAGEFGQDFILSAVGEIGVRFIFAQILEGEYRDALLRNRLACLPVKRESPNDQHCDN